ncbi:hypothetical protein GGR92_004119 [Spirosoma lacussanchae]|uniref:hypothetical protein n=1 Tax=Spirosoma lacussanchae TaxID=1884249 RepID=UPI001109214A|nr:hypothetical protein [Spirosoma lacussanchae]
MFSELYKDVKDFFGSDKLKPLAKLWWALVVLLGLLGIDYFFRFSDSYITNIKIEQIEKIESVLQNKALGNEARAELIRIEQSVINRQGFWDLSSDLASLIQSKINSTNAKSATKADTRPIRKINVFWHYATSGAFFWLFILVSPLIALSSGTNKEGIVGIIIFDIFCVCFALLLAYCLSFVPILWDPIVNYIINLLCNSTPFLIIIRYIIRQGKVTT